MKTHYLRIILILLVLSLWYEREEIMKKIFWNQTFLEK